MGKLQVMCNASPVIGLLSIHKLFLLWQLFDEVVMPEASHNEKFREVKPYKIKVSEA